MHEKSLSVTEITAILEWFYIYKVVSGYAKSILACMENTLKEYKRIWRIRQEYFAYTENTPIDIKGSLSRRIFDQIAKKLWSKITLQSMIEWTKKPSHIVYKERIKKC